MNNIIPAPKNPEIVKAAPTAVAEDKVHINWKRIAGAIIVIAAFLIAYNAFIAPASAKKADAVSANASIVQTSAGNEILVDIDNENSAALIGCLLNITITNNDGSIHTYRHNYNGAVPAGSSDTIALGDKTSYPDAVSVNVEVEKNSCRWYDSDKEKYSIDENADITVADRELDRVRHDVYVDASEYSHPEYSNHSVCVYYYKAGNLVYLTRDISLIKDGNEYRGIFDIPEGFDYDSTRVVLVSWNE